MKQNGFTKIELLVVIILILFMIVLDIVFVLYLNQKSRDIQVLSDIKQIQNGLDLYLANNTTYPETNGKVPLNDNYLGTEKLCTDGFKRYDDKCSKIIFNYMPFSQYQNANEKPYYFQTISIGLDYQLEFELKTNFKDLGLKKGINCASSIQILSQPCAFQ
ncbi:MAG: type II secretion system protein [Candidatus Parcubacteria bacterium]|nr:type II secretion system protein [Candidatus Parcubacteria bacterium]